MNSTPAEREPAPSPNMAPPRGVLIVARSERQAMDWSLALASQDIACVILAPVEGRGWALDVDPRDSARALRTLKAYHVENRRRPTTLTPAMDEFVFHWGVLAWCLLMVLIFWASEAPGSPIKAAGTFITVAAGEGQWWRPVTATFLHAGPDHLASNLTSGFLMIGLLMGRFRVGPALLATLIAGTLGNLMAWFWRGDFQGLGASGVIMGALGMLAVALAGDYLQSRISLAAFVRSMLGGLLLFILLGTSPRSDVLAHAGGFLSGAILGVAFGMLPRRVSTSNGFDLGCALAYLAMTGIAWACALRA